MVDRVLILGASGFIGSYLMEGLGRNPQRTITGTFHSHSEPGLLPLNVLEAGAMCRLLDDLRPQFVVFLAGTKDVERCEREPAYALDLNVQAVRNYVDACAALQIRPYTLFFSTDYVFDGRAGHYSRESDVGPRTVYGLTNLLAERMLLRSGLPGVVLRVSAVMGRRAGFFQWLETGLRNGTTMRLFDNTYFSPTSIGHLCRFVEVCAEASKQSSAVKEGMKVVHLSDGYRMTRYQFCRVVADRLGVTRPLLQPGLADLHASTFQADLSLLPDGQNTFRPFQEWNELEDIF